MKSTKTFILICLLALGALLVMSASSAGNNTTLEMHDFDSYFKMNVPKGISFEKSNSTPGKNMNVSINYENYTQNIYICYAESAGTKEMLSEHYENFAKNDANITFNKTNNTTIIHFKENNTIGEDNYHDMAISGDDERYVLIQCDNETLMKSMASSIRFD